MSRFHKISSDWPCGYWLACANILTWILIILCERGIISWQEITIAIRKWKLNRILYQSSCSHESNGIFTTMLILLWVMVALALYISFKLVWSCELREELCINRRFKCSILSLLADHHFLVLCSRKMKKKLESSTISIERRG